MQIVVGWAKVKEEGKKDQNKGKGKVLYIMLMKEILYAGTREGRKRRRDEEKREGGEKKDEWKE